MIKCKRQPWIWLLLCLASCGEGTGFNSPQVVTNNQQQKPISNQSVSMEKVNSKKSCVHNYSPPFKGKIVISPTDSLAVLSANSSVKDEDLGAIFEADQGSYWVVEGKVEVIINTGFGTIELPENLLVEFSYTNKGFVEEYRDRTLTERYIERAAFRLLPLYYEMDCLNYDIKALQEKISSLGFKPVTLYTQKTIAEIGSLILIKNDGNRLRDYKFSAWRQGDLGIYLSIVQAKINKDLADKNMKHEYLYNLVFDMVNISTDPFWKEIE